MTARTVQQPGGGRYGWSRDLGFGTLIIVVSLAATFAWRFGWVSNPDLGLRLSMVLGGAYLMYTGNGIPKSLKPFGCLPHDSPEAQTFRRFAGWTWVLTGLGLVAVWCAAPRDLALAFTLTCVPLAIALVILKRRTLARG